MPRRAGIHMLVMLLFAAVQLLWLLHAGGQSAGGIRNSNLLRYFMASSHGNGTGLKDLELHAASPSQLATHLEHGNVAVVQPAATSATTPAPTAPAPTTPAQVLVGLIVVGDLEYQALYEPQIESLRCYAHRFSYEMVVLLGNEYAKCARYWDFFFRKHCTVAQFLDSRPPGYVAAVLDADVVAVTMERGLERWSHFDADIQLYERVTLPEIMAGNYMVRNGPFARSFLRRWARYNDRVPSGFSSYDNGAIHLVVMETVQVEGIPRCRKFYRNLDAPDASNLDKYWKFVHCTKDALGPPRSWQTGDGKLTIWPRLQFFVADGVYLTNTASNSIGPVMHHGIKDGSVARTVYWADVHNCKINERNLRTARELGETAMVVARGYTEFFQQGDSCKQCVERCIFDFECSPLHDDEAPLPARSCRNCTEADRRKIERQDREEEVRAAARWHEKQKMKRKKKKNAQTKGNTTMMEQSSGQA